jgi:hypothetical protein
MEKLQSQSRSLWRVKLGPAARTWVGMGLEPVIVKQPANSLIPTLPPSIKFTRVSKANTTTSTSIGSNMDYTIPMIPRPKAPDTLAKLETRPTNAFIPTVKSKIRRPLNLLMSLPPLQPLSQDEKLLRKIYPEVCSHSARLLPVEKHEKFRPPKNVCLSLGPKRTSIKNEGAKEVSNFSRKQIIVNNAAQAREEEVKWTSDKFTRKRIIKFEDAKVLFSHAPLLNESSVGESQVRPWSRGSPWTHEF